MATGDGKMKVEKRSSYLTVTEKKVALTVTEIIFLFA